MLTEGINFIKTSDIELPVFYSAGKNKSNTLWILFSAGGPRRTSKYFYPLFDRISWAKHKFPGPCLIFEDPSYDYNIGIQDGWYLGNKNQPYYKIIADFISSFIKDLSLSNKSLRFFGSSTGGTAALLVSSLFPNSICIANNPQVDISIWPTYYAACTILKRYNLQYDFNIKIKELLKNKNNNIFISFNIGSELDKQQAQQLFSYLDINLYVKNNQIKEGVTKLDNKFIWTYDIKTEINNPHNVLPLFGMLIPIESLFFYDFYEINFKIIEILFSSYKDLMFDYYQLNDKILLSKK